MNQSESINLDINTVIAEYQRVISDLTGQLVLERARIRQMEEQHEEERKDRGKKVENPLVPENGQIVPRESVPGAP